MISHALSTQFVLIVDRNWHTVKRTALKWETFALNLVRNLRAQTKLHLEMFAIGVNFLSLFTTGLRFAPAYLCDPTPIAKTAKDSGAQQFPVLHVQHQILLWLLATRMPQVTMITTGKST